MPGCDELPGVPLETQDGVRYWGLCAAHRHHPLGDVWIVRRLNVEKEEIAHGG